MSRLQGVKDRAAVAIHNAGWALGRKVGVRIAATVSGVLLGGRLEQCDERCDWCNSPEITAIPPTHT